MDAALQALGQRIRAAADARQPLAIRAGGTKDFYGNPCEGDVLDPRPYRGVVAYEPTELVITARCGTPLAELEAVLAERNQSLPFEPPHFGPGATVGGCIAAGLAGPRRAGAGAVAGSVRDFVLGAKLIDGRGQMLAFGGTVMKNVAGYDMARALTGSLGTLGLIVEASIKVLPTPAAEATLRFDLTAADALAKMNQWAGKPLPISGTFWCDGTLYLRLSGANAAIHAACAALGGEPLDDAQATALWTAVREQTHGFFGSDVPLWRMSLPSTTPPLDLPDPQAIEWGGALRWLRSARPAAELRALAARHGGHATLFRGGDRLAGVFHPLPPALAAIHRRLKAEFDPAGIFNRGRMYTEF
ncbi:MAG: glycolate oxidase subunit GlcE [Betaproteobacteria bacterium]